MLEKIKSKLITKRGLLGFILPFMLTAVLLVSSSASDVKAFGQSWYEGFESGGGGLTFALSGFPNVPGTQDEGVPDCMEGGVTSAFAFKGNRSNYYKMTIYPCLDAGGNPINNASHRYYPLYKGRNFKLPTLVMFWFYEDATSWPVAAGTRHSPLSIKDQSPPGPPGCDGTGPDGCIPILTTHISPQGVMDCGHCSMTFQSKTVKVPLKQWVLMSTLIDKNSNVTEWLDDKVVVQGKTNLPFRIVERWHMGFYGEGNGWQTMYNDEMKVYEVADLKEAEAIISQELGGKPVGGGTPPPQPTATPQPSGSATPSPTSAPPDADKFAIGDRVQVTGKTELNVRAGPGAPNAILGTQPVGSYGTVIGGPEFVNGNYWWQINYESTPDGWSIETYLASIAGPSPNPGIKGDLDSDGDVDIFDYNLLTENLGQTNCGNPADIDANCKVDIFDYNLLIENFGKIA